MTKITNITKSRRGIYDSNRKLQFVEAGETKDIDLDDTRHAHGFKLEGFVQKVKDLGSNLKNRVTGNDDDDDAERVREIKEMNKAELQQYLTDNDVDFDPEDLKPALLEKALEHNSTLNGDQ